MKRESAYFSKLSGSLVISSLLLSGCTTVRSVAVPATASFDPKASGLTYFLPKRMIKVSAARELLDPKAIKAAFDEKTTELAAAKKIATADETTVEIATKQLAQLTSSSASAGAIADAQKTLDQASAIAALSGQDRDTLASVVKGLKDMLEVARLSGANSCTYDLKLELLPAQPDRSARYVARLVHSPLRDDTIKLSVGTNGLLTSSNVVAADRTGDIIVELAGAIAAFGGFGLGPMLVGGEPQSCASGPKQFITIFDPTTENPTDELKRNGFPFVIEIDAASVATPTIAGSGLKNGAYSQGVYYRSPTPSRITVFQCKDIATLDLCTSQNQSQPVNAALMMIPQAGPTSFIPMRSSAFVKTVNDVQFEDGVIKSWSAERPSEVLEIVRLPVKILTAIVSVPAQLLSVKVNYSTQDKALIEGQQAQIKAQQNLNILKACLKAAGTDETAQAACL